MNGYYTLSLHDALPISTFFTAIAAGVSIVAVIFFAAFGRKLAETVPAGPLEPTGDRKSTRLNSSHPSISYAVFCLKKKSTNDLSLSVVATDHLISYTGT